jgi:hypothetical protein
LDVLKTMAMKKIARYENHAFLLQEKADLSDETIRNLHSMVNVRLVSSPVK